MPASVQADNKFAKGFHVSFVGMLSLWQSTKMFECIQHKVHQSPFIIYLISAHARPSDASKALSLVESGSEDEKYELKNDRTMGREANNKLKDIIDNIVRESVSRSVGQLVRQRVSQSVSLNYK